MLDDCVARDGLGSVRLRVWPDLVQSDRPLEGLNSSGEWLMWRRSILSAVLAGCLAAVALPARGQGPSTRPAGDVRPDEPASATRDARATLAVVPFDVLGSVGVRDAGRILAERLLPMFAGHYQIIDQTQLKHFLDQDDLTIAGLVEAAAAPPGRKTLARAVKLRAVKYLVVGSISGLPDGSLSITARLADWQTGTIRGGRIARVGAASWGQLQGRMPELAGKLLGAVAGDLPRRLAVPGRRPMITLDLAEGVAMELVLIPAGKFTMGSGPDEKGRGDDEGPQRVVTIGRPFYHGVTEVTQRQYQAVMGKNPSRFAGPDNPAERISWDDATAFCRRASAKVGKTVRLPTEAEWEYACRAGAATPFNTGRTLHADQANIDGAGARAGAGSRGPRSAFRNATMPVGSFVANAWGLYDMHGNVWEWCRDWYAPRASVGAAAAEAEAENLRLGHHRVLRGGSWINRSPRCRSAARSSGAPHWRFAKNGFRVVVDKAPGQ